VRSDADILPDHIEGMPALDIEIAIETAAEDDLALMEDIDRSEINALAAQEEPLDPADEEEEF
jgi:hypothetical protein